MKFLLNIVDCSQRGGTTPDCESAQSQRPTNSSLSAKAIWIRHAASADLLIYSVSACT